MFKAKKYNVVLVLLLLIFGIVGSGFVAISNANITNATDETEIVVPTDDAPVQEDNPLPDGLTTPSATATAMERIEFAYAIFNKGKGYTSYASQIVSVAGQSQSVGTRRYRGNNYDLSEEFYKYYGMFAIGKNELTSIYSNGTDFYMKTLRDSSKYDFSTKTYDYNAGKDDIWKTTVADWETKQLKLNNFFTTINHDTTTILTYDKGSKASYYTITLKVRPDRIDDKFMNLFASYGITISKIKSVVLTYKIDKTTGYMLSYSGKAVFDATYLLLTAEVSVDLKETYFTMNSSAESTIKSIAEKSFDMKF